MFRGHVPGGTGGEGRFPQTPRIRILLGQDHDSKPRGSGSCWPRIITQNPEDQDPAGPGSPLKTPRIRALLAPKAEFGTGPRRRSGGLGLRRGSTTWPPTGPRRLTGAKGRTGYLGENRGTAPFLWENVAGRTICFLQKRFCPKLIACFSPWFSLVLVRTFRLGRNTLNECRVGQNLFEGHCDVQFRTCLYQTSAKLTLRGLGGPGPPLRILAGSPGGCQGLVQSRAFTFPD